MSRATERQASMPGPPGQAAVPPGLLRQMTADPPLKAPVSVTWFGEMERSHPT